MSRRTNHVASAALRARGRPMVEVDMDVLDIARRIQEGDELWRGDPSMCLCFNELTEQFEVLAIDGKGDAYVVLTADDCDQRILMRLVESDWQRGSRQMIDELVRREKAGEKVRESMIRDRRAELSERAAWGIKRAFAQHLGGKSFSYSLYTGGRT